MQQTLSSNGASLDAIFSQVQAKCLALGVVVDKESFLKNKQKYYLLVEKYNISFNKYLYREKEKSKEAIINLVSTQNMSVLEARAQVYQNNKFEFEKSLANQNQANFGNMTFNTPQKLENPDFNYVSSAKVNNLLQGLKKSRYQHRRILDMSCKSIFENKENEPYLKMIMKALNIPADQEYLFFSKLLKSYDTLENFIKKYKDPDDISNEVVLTQKQTKLKSKARVINLAASGYSIYKKFKLDVKSLFTWRLSQKKVFKIKDINFNFHFNPNNEKIVACGRQTLKYAAVTVPFLFLGYFGHRQMLAAKADAQVFKKEMAQKISSLDTIITKGIKSPQVIETKPVDVAQQTKKAKTEKSENNAVQLDIKPIQPCTNIVPQIKVDPHCADFSECVSLIKKDIDAQSNFGLSKDLFNRFMRESKPLADMYEIEKYHKLTKRQEKIILRNQIYDRYLLGAIEDKNLGEYLYSYLINNNVVDHESETLIAGIQNYYVQAGKDLNAQQLNKLYDHFKNGYDAREWRSLIAGINATAFNTQNIVYTEDYEKVLRAQKDADLEVFTNLFKVCALNNCANIAYGHRRKTYKEANKALKGYGLDNISPGYHCAGMSIAGICQAADLFKEVRPDSYLNESIKQLLSKCRNTNSCHILKNDFNKSTQSVCYSSSIERDIKNYMKNHDNAIVFGWAARNKKNFHHLNFVSSEANSNDAYTYITYNREHFGNETTFMYYMDSRKYYGPGGYYFDFTKALDNAAEKYLAYDIQHFEGKEKSFFDRTQNLFAMISSRQVLGG